MLFFFTSRQVNPF